MGFSLLELMIVISIIGLLAQLAVPKYQMFMAKARQAEGKTNLSHIYTLEMSYHADNGTFFDVPYFGRHTADPNACTFTPNPLGFSLGQTCSKIRYVYQVSPSNGSYFFAIAVGALGIIVAGCGLRDYWYIEPDKVIKSYNDGMWGDPVVRCL